MNFATRRLVVRGKRALSSAAYAVEAYAPPVQAMHWAMGGCVLACFGFVQAAQNVKGKKKGEYMFLHKSFGLAAAFLLGPRLAARLGSRSPKAFSAIGWEKALATASHGIMYGMLIIMPVTGVAMGYYGGKGLPFFWTTIPGAEQKDGAIAKQAFQYHKQVGWYMEMLFLGHMGGVAYHTAMGHGVLSRILPFFK